MTENDLVLCKTCSCCPEQYDLVDRDGYTLAYFRLRHGYFSVECPDVGGDLVYQAYPDGDGEFEDYERDTYITSAMEAVRKRYGWEEIAWRMT